MELSIVARTASETINVLKIVIPAIFFGLTASSYMYSIPLFKRLVERITHLTSKFGMKSGVAVAAFLIHPVVSYTLLSEFFRKKIIDEREVILAVLVGTFPRALRLTILFLIPVALPTLGVWGIYYVALVLLTRGVISVFGIFIARKTLNGETIDLEIPEFSLRDVISRFVKIAVVLSITIFLVMLIFNLGLINYLKAFAPHPSAFGLSPASVIVVVTGFPSMLAAIATAGSLLSKGVLSGRSLLISLFLASIAHSFVEVSRNTFPVSASIMGRSLALRVATCILISRIVANLLAILLVLLV